MASQALVRPETRGARPLLKQTQLRCRPRTCPTHRLGTLPLLGVKYADYYRHTKIQETVYELLTEQNELAKVEEAKETPSVKVLDPAEIPEKKSYPPRLIILCLGTLIGAALAIFRVIGTTRWQQMDPEDRTQSSRAGSLRDGENRDALAAADCGKPALEDAVDFWPIRAARLRVEQISSK